MASFVWFDLSSTRPLEASSGTRGDGHSRITHRAASAHLVRSLRVLISLDSYSFIRNAQFCAMRSVAYCRHFCLLYGDSLCESRACSSLLPTRRVLSRISHCPSQRRALRRPSFACAPFRIAVQPAPPSSYLPCSRRVSTQAQSMRAVKMAHPADPSRSRSDHALLSR